ncbi:hypothetical protein DFS33DRAFT_1273438 [Desarmillaria ectypa]|nr:hypothetical protein DFS33DRAFT_1273438 [Desarmillaria ectypa]
MYPESFYTGCYYAELPFDRTRYWLLGPEMGRRLVLIHGLSIPSIVWKDIASQLAKRGYRVLMYGTQYGAFLCGFSLLMQCLNWAKAILIGGGAVTVGVISHFPHLVEDHIVLIAPAGVTKIRIASCELPSNLKTPPPSMVHRAIAAVPRTSRMRSDPTSEVPTSNIPTLLPDGANVELVTIEGAGHDLTISQAKLVLEELNRYNIAIDYEAMSLLAGSQRCVKKPTINLLGIEGTLAYVLL